MMDNVKTTRLFLTVAQIGSLSGASRQTGLSPASVSRQITALEEDLGVRLLNRTTRKLTLTEAGQVYLERAERLVQDIDELRDAVSQLAIRPAGYAANSVTHIIRHSTGRTADPLFSRAVSGPQTLFVADRHGRGLNRTRH
jgi:DNA-binding transcriptional LysR family regulator